MTLKRDRCFVLHRLTLASLPVLWAASLFYREVAFVRCSPRVKKHFRHFVLGLGATQATEHAFYPDGVFAAGQVEAIRAGTEKGARNEWLRRAFSAYGKSPRYADLVDQAFVRGWARYVFLTPSVQRFMEDAAKRCGGVDFMSAHNPDVFCWPATLPDTVRFVRFHIPLAWLAGLFTRTAFVALLVVFPFLNLALLWRKGVRPTGAAHPPVLTGKRILFIHRHHDLEDNKARDLYLFHEGVLAYNDCAHFLMVTSRDFTERKTALISGAGGEVIRTRDLRIPFRQVGDLVVDFYRTVLPASRRLILSGDVNLETFRQLLETLHLMSLASALLDAAPAGLAYFETETAPFTNIAAVEARKRQIRTMSMLHGASAQINPNTSRSNMQYEYFLTPGRDNAVTRDISPGIDHVVAVGNHEIDLLVRKAHQPHHDLLPEWVRRDRGRYKVVGCFLVLLANLVDVRSFHGKTEYLDESLCRDHAQRYLRPLFDWLAMRDDVIFVWKPKTKNTAIDAHHPWVAELLDKVPPERYIVLPDAALAEVIEISDVCIGTGGSSALGCAMAMGKPGISLDLMWGGWTRKYHPWMAAETGEELAENLENILAHGLPPDVFDAFNADWYADGVVDHKTAERISRLIGDILGEETLAKTA